MWHTLLTNGAARSMRTEFVQPDCEWSRRLDHAPSAVLLNLGTVDSGGSTIGAPTFWLENSVDEITAITGHLIITPFVGE
jgi:hypothetical protein